MQPGTNEVCGRIGCTRQAEKLHSTYRAGKPHFYCGMHYRVRMMIKTAKHDNKHSPPEDELIQMLESNRDLKCPRCKKRMTILSDVNGKRGSLVTLQHNNDGTIELCCHACNVGHGHSLLGDRYWDLAPGEKYCPRCEKVKNKDEFHKSFQGTRLRTHACKECSRRRNRTYYKKKKELHHGN